MEDLRKYDRAPEFTLSNGLKVVRAIATLHSHFKGASLGTLANHTGYMRRHVRENYRVFKEKWSRTLSVDVFALFDHAFEFYEDAEAHLLRMPCTLLHGEVPKPVLG